MNIYVSHTREAILRSFAKSKNSTISDVIGSYIDTLGDNLISNATNYPKKYVEPPTFAGNQNGEPQETPVTPFIKCDLPFCKSRSQGKYKIVTDAGETELEKNLCPLHWHQARKEGEVFEVV